MYVNSYLLKAKVTTTCVMKIVYSFYYNKKKTMSVRTHGRCVNIFLLHGTCSISMKTLVNVTLGNK